MKRLYITFFVTILILLIPLMASASVNIVIDGESLICTDSDGNTVEPFVFEGTTYVPVRAIAEAFEIAVSWDQDTKTVHLGKVGGDPSLGEHINIFYNGEEFIPLDATSNRVYPILSEGTTYLPIRGIGTLFNKSIYWDQFTQTATLTTNPSQNAIAYLTDSVKNTASLQGTTVNLTINGKAFMNEALFSEKEYNGEAVYSPNGFTLSTILPDSYTRNAAYLGSGKYFIVVPSDRFLSDQALYEKLAFQQTPTDYSSLYIFIGTKGGYVTDISLTFSGKAHYSGIVLDQMITTTAALNYPEGFEFPITPYPDKPLGDNEKPISAEDSEKSDATMINSLVRAYVDYLTSGQVKKLFAMTAVADHNAVFSNKSAAQLTMEQNNIAKKLVPVFEKADGTFTLDSLVYIDTESLTYPAEAAARAEIGINFTDGDDGWTDSVEVIFIKRDNNWYLDISSVMALYKY